MVAFVSIEVGTVVKVDGRFGKITDIGTDEVSFVELPLCDSERAIEPLSSIFKWTCGLPAGHACPHYCPGGRVEWGNRGITRERDWPTEY